MAIKTFTTGEVLTAADTNEYLANSGLVYVSGGSFSNVLTFDVTGFTSTFDTYQLQISVQKHTSGTADVTAQIVSGATVRSTDYYGGQFRVSNAATTGTLGVRNNANNFYVVSTTGALPSLFNATITGIGNLKFNITCQAIDNNNVFASFGGYSNYNATSSFDIIRFSAAAEITGSYSLTGVRKP